MSEEVNVSVDDGIATITLNRPEKRNAINRAMLDALSGFIDQLEQDGATRVAVLRGAGVAFCSGLDLRDRDSRVNGAAPESIVTPVFRRLERSPIVSIAAVHVDAIAGGCELALHCDLRVAADTAHFAMPLARLGLVLPLALTQKLVEVIGTAHTRQLLLTGRPITARRAYEIGMVHETVSHDQLEKTVAALAQTIATNAPLSLAGMKAMIGRTQVLRESIAHDDVDQFVIRARSSTDAREGVQAQLERRTPIFRGE